MWDVQFSFFFEIFPTKAIRTKDNFLHKQSELYAVFWILSDIASHYLLCLEWKWFKPSTRRLLGSFISYVHSSLIFKWQSNEWTERQIKCQNIKILSFLWCYYNDYSNQFIMIKSIIISKMFLDVSKVWFKQMANFEGVSMVPRYTKNVISTLNPNQML